MSRHNHLIQDLGHAPPQPRSPIHDANHKYGLALQLAHRFPAILEAAGAFHVADGIALDAVVRRLLLQDVDELEVERVGADAVDDGEGEFALGQVFAEAFVVGVFRAGEVHVVVADLVEEADDVHEGDAVSVLTLSESVLAIFFLGGGFGIGVCMLFRTCRWNSLPA